MAQLEYLGDVGHMVKLPNAASHPHDWGGSIKIRILFSSPVGWNTLKSVCVAMENDPYIDLLIIDSSETEHNEILQSYNHIKIDDYAPQCDLPDILIITTWVDKHIENLRIYAKCIVMIWPTILPFDALTKPSRLVVNKFIDTIHPEYWFLTPMTKKTAEKNYPQIAEKIIEIDSPKYDNIYNFSNSTLPSDWQKLKNKRIILWCTTHGLFLRNNYLCELLSCFGKYMKTIFHYMAKNSKIGIIIRFHPSLKEEMFNTGLWNPEILNTFQNYCLNSENIVIDNNDTYDIAFGVSDVIITEGGGLTYSTALSTLKPVCIAYYQNKGYYNEPEYENACYQVYTNDELINFFETIKKGEDSMLEKRKEVVKKYVKHFDGKNGERVKNLLKKIYEKDINLWR